MLMLPLKVLNGWLFGIEANRVKPEIRDKVMAYQKECFDVLHDYWHNKSESKPETKKLQKPEEVIDAEYDNELYLFVEIMTERILNNTQGYDYHIDTLSTAQVMQYLYHLKTEPEGLEVRINLDEISSALNMDIGSVYRAVDRLCGWSFLLKKHNTGKKLWLCVLSKPLEKALRDARQILSQYKRDMGSEEIFVLNNTLNCFISNSSNRVQLLEKHNGMFPGNDAS